MGNLLSININNGFWRRVLCLGVSNLLRYIVSQSLCLLCYSKMYFTVLMVHCCNDTRIIYIPSVHIYTFCKRQAISITEPFFHLHKVSFFSLVRARVHVTFQDYMYHSPPHTHLPSHGGLLQFAHKDRPVSRFLGCRMFEFPSLVFVEGIHFVQNLTSD